MVGQGPTLASNSDCTGDGGVDGVIRERLGLDRVYLQAKRYKPGNPVDSPTVQGFVGALVGRGAQKGVLITTSTFTRNTPSKLPSNREPYSSFSLWEIP